MLHIIRHSPFETNCLESCLSAFSLEKDVLLLIENGVFNALANTEPGKKLAAFMKDRSIFVLAPHAKERGISHALIEQATKIGYENFVDLVVTDYPVCWW
jgi:sulfur relay protein TusB/DsrH